MEFEEGDMTLEELKAVMTKEITQIYKEQKKIHKDGNKEDIVEIDGCKIFIEDGKVRTIFIEKIQTTGKMSIQKLRNLLKTSLKMHRDLIKNKIYGKI